MPEQAVVDGLTLTGDKVEVKPEEKERPDIGKSRKPPKEGLCKRCGKFLPINRLMLCYRCWVKVQNEKKGWREGLPHPKDCGCEDICAFDKKTWGN